MTAPMSVISTHDQIYSNLLSSRYDLQRLYDQDISLAEDPDFYRVFMSDMKFSGIYRQLRYEVAASGYQIHPGSRSRASALKARILSSILKKSNLAEAIHGLTRALLMARAYAYPEGRGYIATYCGTLPQEWFTVFDIKDIDKQRVTLKPKKVWVNPDGQLADPQRGIDRDPQGKYEIRVERWLGDPADGGRYRPMSKRYAAALIELVFEDEEGRLGMGFGFAEAGYIGLRFKAILMKAGVRGAVKWAEEMLVGMIDPNRPASKRKPNSSLAQDLLTKLTAMREGGVIVVPEGLADVKSIASTGTGHQMVMDMLNYVDDSFRECCGLAMPGGNDAQKTGAGLKVGQQKANKAIQHHRNMIAACLNRGFIPMMCRLNRQQFEAVFEAAGIVDDSEDPILKIVDDAENDPEKMVERINNMKDTVDIPLEWAHEVTQIPMPSDGEPIVAKSPAPAPMPGAAPGKSGASDQNPNSPDSPQNKGPGDKFNSKDSLKETEHRDAEAEQKQAERTDVKSKSYADAGRDDVPLIPQVINVPAPVVHVHAEMPQHPDVRAAEEREAMYRAQIDELKQQNASDRAAYREAMDREVVVNVAAPVVNVDVAASPIPPAPDVRIEMKPLISVEPSNVVVNVAPSPAPDVTVVNPARRREIMLKRNAANQIVGAEVVEAQK
jgi:hypothetical protein